MPVQQQQQQSDRTYPGSQGSITSSSQATLVEDGDSIGSFLDQVSQLQQSVKRLNVYISDLQRLRSRSLGIASEGAEYEVRNYLLRFLLRVAIITQRTGQRVADEVSYLTMETRRLTNNIKLEIKAMEKANSRGAGVPQADLKTRRDQTAAVKARFVEAVQRYAQVEQTHRQASKQRLERQYRIVSPNASDMEVKAAVENAGEGGQIFSQAVRRKRKIVSIRNVAWAKRLLLARVGTAYVFKQTRRSAVGAFDGAGTAAGYPADREDHYGTGAALHRGKHHNIQKNLDCMLIKAVADVGDGRGARRAGDQDRRICCRSVHRSPESVSRGLV
jgi:hypothetical protein